MTVTPRMKPRIASGSMTSRTLGSGLTTRSASTSSNATVPLGSVGADTSDHNHNAEPAVAEMVGMVSTQPAETDSHYNARAAEQKTIYGITARRDGIGEMGAETVEKKMEDGTSNQLHHHTTRSNPMDFDSALNQDLLQEWLLTDMILEDGRRLACLRNPERIV